MTTTGLEKLTGDYTLDPAHTRLGFVARHAMITKVRGQFDEFESRAHIDFTDPAKCSAEITIEAASIDTRNEQRDGHLRTNDFFDIPNHPKITYRSTGVEKVDDATYRVTGDLTIRGVTRKVTAPLRFLGRHPQRHAGELVGFETTFTIDRTQFGVGSEGGGEILIGNEVEIRLLVSAAKK